MAIILSRPGVAPCRRSRLLFLLASGLPWASAEDAPTPVPVPSPGFPAEHLTVTAADAVYEPPEYVDSQTWLRDAPLQKRFGVREALDIPGTLGDPVMAVANLPGVVTGPGGELLVHGSKEGESSSSINHLPVGYLFHLDGLHSVVSPESIEQIDVYLGGFDATYGDAIGGVIDLTPRYPLAGNEAYVHVGLLDSAIGFATRPAPGWSLAMNARRSYLDLIVPVDYFSEEDDQGREDKITVFPNYTDANTLLAYTTDRHQFSLEVLFAMDEFGAESNTNAVKDPAATGNIDEERGFLTSGMRWRYDDGAYRAHTLVGFMYEWDKLNIFREYSYTQRSYVSTLFHLSTLRLDPVQEVSGGFEIKRRDVPLQATIPVPPDEDDVDFDLTSAEIYTIDQRIDPTVYSIFLQDLVSLRPDLRARVGVRAEYSDFDDESVRLMPRGALIWDVTAHNSLSASSGLYSSRPDDYKRFDDIGNPELGDQSAIHYALAWNQRSEMGTWTVEPYYKDIRHLAVSDDTEQWRDDGTGFAYGVDVSYHLRGPTWYVMASYAWQEAERQLSSEDGERYSFYGDVTHSAQLAASFRFAPGWSASFLAKYATGQPYTPIVGTYQYTDIDGNVRARPSYGKPYSDRFSDFFTLNQRVAWTTMLSGGQQIELAFEVLNVTNHKNLQGFEYDDQYNKTDKIYSYGLLPSFDATIRF